MLFYLREDGFARCHVGAADEDRGAREVFSAAREAVAKKQRGLLAETMLLWYGEFGRSPRVNRGGGREHWGFAQSALLAGGGVRGGQVYGSSDRHAAYAAELPVSPDNLAATVFDALGVPLDADMIDAQGRPMPVCRGKPVRGLF